jgi:dihydrodipicolinate synthase/N-acetylneuraminate lyase
MGQRADHQCRREFLALLASSGLAACASVSSAGATEAGSKPLNGVFPIGQTPFTESDKLDLDCLVAQVRFVNRGRVHGFAWPQIASGWSMLSESERLAGAEAILATGKGQRTALVIGVQDKAGSIEQARKYAKHAEKNGADGIISLPPPGSTDARTILEYYKQLGLATDLPLFVQTTGNLSVDDVIAMYKAIPTMRVVKDEAGNPLERVTPLIEKSGGKLAIFSGNGVRTMIEEMELGFAGHCPTTGMADLYQAAWDLWHENKHGEAFDMFGRVLAFGSIPGSGSYVLVARGVFKETTKYRPTPGMDGPKGPPHLDAAGKKLVHEALGTYLKPYLRA